MKGKRMALQLMFITNEPSIAEIAQQNGVERIWIDLEVLGKEERQRGMNTVKSNHCIEDIRKIKPLLSKSKLLVRVNPWNNNSEKEIEEVICAGADLIMLPMWRTLNEVKRFLDTVNGRCKTILLLETREAEDCLDEVLKLGGMDEIHIGLNDLSLSYNLDFLFELLADGTVERICKKIAPYGIPYGFGGIAKLGCGELPAEKIILEHYRLGSTRAILSRSFCNVNSIKDLNEVRTILSENLKDLREFEASIDSNIDFESNRKEIKEIVNTIVQKKREN